jgi:WhiB family redox-sensing transcriptional regulator
MSPRLPAAPGRLPALNAAACAAYDPEAWFSDHPVTRGAAAWVCRSCPMRAACLAGAIDRDEAAGIWGGVDFETAAHLTGESREKARETVHAAARGVLACLTGRAATTTIHDTDDSDGRACSLAA